MVIVSTVGENAQASESSSETRCHSVSNNHYYLIAGIDVI
jgi:hypothetical protein